MTVFFANHHQHVHPSVESCSHYIVVAFVGFLKLFYSLRFSSILSRTLGGHRGMQMEHRYAPDNRSGTGLKEEEAKVHTKNTVSVVDCFSIAN